MLYKKFFYTIIGLTALLIAGYIFQDRKKDRGSDTFIKYELVSNWPKLPANILLGNPTGIGIDTSQNIFLFHRAGREWPLLGTMPDTYIKDNTILLIDNRTGTLLNSWGGNLFLMPHGLTVDRFNNVWVTDVGLHQVFKFSHEGQLLLTLGIAKVPGNDQLHFNRPTDIAVAGDGSFYVSDGYSNSRVVKFSAEGKYLFEWGKKGRGKGDFNIPHGIDIDAGGNIYVADRENSRVQVFDASGRFVKQISGNFGNICSVTIEKNSGKLLATDDLSYLKISHRGSDIIVFDTTGTIQTRFGRSGSYAGPVCWYHDIAVDNDHNIYVSDILGNRLQKFKRIVSETK